MRVDFTHRGVVLDERIFISGDYHIGYSDVIDSMTLEQERSEISERVRKVLEKWDLDHFIINGDLFHEFNPPSDEAREMYREMVSRIEVDCQFTAIRGNHDSAAESEYPDLVDFKSSKSLNFSDRDVVVTHGHQELESDGDMYVIGHLHPVVKINGIQWPVYLSGDSIYEGDDVMILPTFTGYQDGVVVSDRMRLDIDFPLINRSQFGDLKPSVYDESEDTVREFPKLSESSKYFGI